MFLIQDLMHPFMMGSEFRDALYIVFPNPMSENYKDRNNKQTSKCCELTTYED